MLIVLWIVLGLVISIYGTASFAYRSGLDGEEDAPEFDLHQVWSIILIVLGPSIAGYMIATFS